MAKEYTYDDVPLILNSISWQLKCQVENQERIADLLQSISCDMDRVATELEIMNEGKEKTKSLNNKPVVVLSKLGSLLDKS